MTHAWLLTGPPGSGRSTAARAFAAALQCTDQGCGRCPSCRAVRNGSHTDVEVVSTRLLSIGVDEARELVQRGARHPSGRRWQVLVIEDADRLTERAGNALLKAVEEPATRTVWLLCAPSPQDVIPTIRSRCRHVALRTPPAQAVADVLVRRDGVDPAMAAFAARAAQGHIGRAKRLATDERARLSRSQVLGVPQALTTVGGCVALAAALVDAASGEAKEAAAEVDHVETAELARALGVGTVGRRVPAAVTAALKELEREQRRRLTRIQRDALDRALVDLASFYRDVLALQWEAPVSLVNEELRADVLLASHASTPEQTLHRLDAVLAARAAIDANVAPLLAIEAMMLALRTGEAVPSVRRPLPAAG